MPNFHILNLATGEPAKDAEGNVIVAESGKEAAEVAKYLTLELRVKHQPRPVLGNVDWRAREAGRFRDGTYFPAPWDSENWFHGSDADRDHFLHVSIDKDKMVAFTPNDEYGVADRQVRLEPGTYLDRFFGHKITSEAIRTWVARFSVQYGDYQFHLAKGSDEIVSVYMNGPTSCMTHNISDYSCNGHHPAEAYGGPDLAVACFKNPGDSRWAARAVVWPDKKVWTRFYGDHVRLRAMLEAAGYKAGRLDGARLKRICLGKDGMGRSMYAVPYLDTNSRLKDDGEYLVVDDTGYIPVTAGRTTDMRRLCLGCQTLSAGSFYNAVDEAGRGMTVCETCARGAYRYVDATTGYRARREDLIYFGERYYHRRREPERYIHICAMTGVPIDSCRAINLGRDPKTGETIYVSSEWYGENMKHCSYCNMHVPKNGPAPECAGKVNRVPNYLCPSISQQVRERAMAAHMKRVAAKEEKLMAHNPQSANTVVTLAAYEERGTQP